MKLTDDEIRAIQTERIRQAENTAGLGVLRAEYLQRESFWKKKIDESSEKQRALGESILQAHGIHPAAGDYTIDESAWVILQLVGGKWRPVSEVQ